MEKSPTALDDIKALWQGGDLLGDLDISLILENAERAGECVSLACEDKDIRLVARVIGRGGKACIKQGVVILERVAAKD